MTQLAKNAAFSLLAIAAMAQPAAATDFHSLDAINAQVAQFTGAAIGHSGGARTVVDPSLRLSTCSQPLALSWYGSRRDAVAVRCGDTDGWRLFVPVRSAEQEAVQVIVSRRDLVRVEAGGRGFSVWRNGEAQEDGAAGDWIRVRIEDNSRRGTVVTGQVMADGRVRIPIR